MALTVLLSLGAICLVSADSFLGTQRIERAEIEQLLLSEWYASGEEGMLDEKQESLRPMFESLPKSSQGTLEPSIVRYALHRHFMRKHGWVVSGLQAHDSGISSNSSSVIRDRAPSYIQGLITDRMNGAGLGLRELAVFASTLEDLIHSESAQQLEHLYDLLKLSPEGDLAGIETVPAFDAYLVMHILGGHRIKSFSMLQVVMKKMPQVYQDWESTSMYFEDMRRTIEVQGISRANPFVQQAWNFDRTMRLVDEFSHGFGSFQNLECRKLKNMLTDMEAAGTGRVPLSKFYTDFLNGGFYFAESVDYLRKQGILDERDTDHPSVVIPNYITGHGNCLTPSGYYKVCCMNECEGLLGHIEAELRAPTATPTRIANIVASLASETVDAPRNLSVALLSRLHEIADFHSGEVPLHGRLFQQWMHHAYPRECPFPQLAVEVQPMSPSEWTKAFGPIQASKTEMQKYAERIANATLVDQEGPENLPWMLEEQLVADQGPLQRRGTSVVRRIAFVAVAAALSVAFVRLMLGSAKACSVGLQNEKVYV